MEWKQEESQSALKGSQQAAQLGTSLHDWAQSAPDCATSCIRSEVSWTAAERKRGSVMRVRTTETF